MTRPYREDGYTPERNDGDAWERWCAERDGPPEREEEPEECDHDWVRVTVSSALDPTEFEVVCDTCGRTFGES